MKLEDQVCALEYAKKLKELGVKQESLFYWIKEDSPYIWYNSNNYPIHAEKFYYSAYTVAELGEMLPDWFDSGNRDKSTHDWMCRVFEKNSDKANCAFADKEVNARAKMLIYLIENKWVENERT
jgi:hypothetical protein